MPGYFVVYLACMSAVGFALMGLDKRRAREGKWRVSERVLFAIALLGGSLGSIAGMWCFRHKTRHWYFVLGLPVILVLQILVLAVLFF